MAKYKVYVNTVNGHEVHIKNGFNWPVFFFGPIWYLLNGMAGKGIGWLIVAILIGLPTLGIGSVIVWIIAGVKANKDKENQYLEKGYVLKRDY
jgi:hypothetical protein